MTITKLSYGSVLFTIDLALAFLLLSLYAVHRTPAFLLGALGLCVLAVAWKRFSARSTMLATGLHGIGWLLVAAAVYDYFARMP